MLKYFTTLLMIACLVPGQSNCKPSASRSSDFSQIITLPTFWIRLPNVDYRARVNEGGPGGGSKIAGGSIANKQQFPYQAAILINFPDGSGTLCGGSIVSATFVLTAAHCLGGALDATVVVGTNIISIPSDEQAVEIDVTFHDMLAHPNYDAVNVFNDIAILRLTKALTFSDKIQPIRLPSRQEAKLDLASVDATVSGWGALSGDEFADISDSLKLELRFVSNPVISNGVCEKVFENLIRDFHVCVSGDNGRNACQGDSGGPLTANLNNMATLIGIVSYGSTNGCERGSPAVYTRIGYYLDWISHITDIVIEMDEQLIYHPIKPNWTVARSDSDNGLTMDKKQLVLMCAVLLTVVCANPAVLTENARIFELPIAKELPDFDLRDVPSGRVSGGEIAAPGDVPYAVGILSQGPTGTRWCGGSLISSNFVLTVANCFVIISSPITALLGASNMTDVADIIPATTLIMHIGYDPQSNQNDIALLELFRDVQFGPTISPVRLPNWRQMQSTFNGQLATVSGWGALWQNAPELLPLNDLRRVGLPVISNTACSLRFPGAITDAQICVEAINGSPCLGDQGGPLTVADPDGNSTLVGTFSYVSILGCNSGWPAVFTRITSHLLWIQSNTNITILDDFEF
ncbi:transmembrane protease serine 9-like [Topomyia yanbarensis]|uniref:transmembrane protease serine 9-like n=1 Tax=Topomyia yanbarensis TaxID=2498891 RepID=UPI00273CD993|nr:transmembrane protease serine 9-like [Topomyia yanbarensis]